MWEYQLDTTVGENAYAGRRPGKQLDMSTDKVYLEEQQSPNETERREGAKQEERGEQQTNMGCY